MSAIATLNPFSPVAGAITHLMVGTFVLLFVIFFLVAGLITFALITYRDREGAEAPKQSFGSRRLEWTWTIAAAVTVTVLTLVMLPTITKSDPAPGGKPDVRVIGRQWWWEIDYLDSGVVAANEMHIPVGKRLLVDVESEDVIHDFWVPELGRKIDAVPGHPNLIWIEADAPGTYLGACAEFCGVEHAWMRILAIAQPQPEFDEWQRAQLAVPETPTSGAAGEGARLFREQTCVNCHTIVGTTGNQRVGPDLTHIASRRTLAAGAALNTPEQLLKWLKHPDSIKPQSHMPDFQLNDDQAASLTAYLETLK